MVPVLHDRDDRGTYWQEMERTAPQLRLRLATISESIPKGRRPSQDRCERSTNGLGT